jgi:hypothetical protein
MEETKFITRVTRGEGLVKVEVLSVRTKRSSFTITKEISDRLVVETATFKLCSTKHSDGSVGCFFDKEFTGPMTVGSNYYYSNELGMEHLIVEANRWGSAIKSDLSRQIVGGDKYRSSDLHTEVNKTYRGGSNE